ncbi:MAG: DUF1624 domain-containing protein [Bauldia sp.]|nr:DUF1624 domain-containing protein [Bauldia sp.]
MTGPQTKTTDGAGHRPRLAAIDIAKGIAIIAMVAYHFSWDLSYRQLIAADVGSDLGWRLFARGIAGAFVFLVGVNLVMAARTGFHPRPYLRRLAILLAAALLVTGFTYYAFGAEGFVFFGILHLILVASVLALPFLWAPAWLALIAAVFFLAGAHFLTSPVFDGWPFYWLGLSPDPPVSYDFVPVFPWFGVALLGVAAGKLLVANPGLGLWRWQPTGWPWKALMALGRWSLIIYLLHQVILFPLVGWIAPLVGPSHNALMRQFVALSETRCAMAGYAAEPCAAFAVCVAQELGQDDGFLLDYWRGGLSEDDNRRFTEVESDCIARHLATVPDGTI